MSEASRADEGFLFAGARPIEDYRQLVGKLPKLRDRPDGREPLLRLDSVLAALEGAGVEVPTPTTWELPVDRPLPMPCGSRRKCTTSSTVNGFESYTLDIGGRTPFRPEEFDLAWLAPEVRIRFSRTEGGYELLIEQEGTDRENSDCQRVASFPLTDARWKRIELHLGDEGFWNPPSIPLHGGREGACFDGMVCCLEGTRQEETRTVRCGGFTLDRLCQKLADEAEIVVRARTERLTRAGVEELEAGVGVFVGRDWVLPSSWIEACRQDSLLQAAAGRQLQESAEGSAGSLVDEMERARALAIRKFQRKQRCPLCKQTTAGVERIYIRPPCRSLRRLQEVRGWVFVCSGCCRQVSFLSS